MKVRETERNEGKWIVEHDDEEEEDEEKEKEEEKLA